MAAPTGRLRVAPKATRDTVGILALDNVAAVLAGRPPLTPVQ